jgi:hypothetical protein
MLTYCELAQGHGIEFNDRCRGSPPVRVTLHDLGGSERGDTQFNTATRGNLVEFTKNRLDRGSGVLFVDLIMVNRNQFQQFSFNRTEHF